MSEIIVRCKTNGPLIVEGAVKVLDANGNAYPINPAKPSVALCRCGLSAGKPFCDGSHSRQSWVSNDPPPPAAT